MRRVFVSCLLLAVLLVMVSQPTFGQGSKSEKKSLYDRLGGSEAIGKIFDETGGRMAADPLLAKFFQGQSKEALTEQRNQTIAFLCHATGGPCTYSGPPIKTAHGPLNINEDQWKAFLKHFSEALDSQKVASKEKAEFIAVVKKFKSDVVAKK